MVPPGEYVILGTVHEDGSATLLHYAVSPALAAALRAQVGEPFIEQLVTADDLAGGPMGTVLELAD